MNRAFFLVTDDDIPLTRLRKIWKYFYIFITIVGMNEMLHNLTFETNRTRKNARMTFGRHLNEHIVNNDMKLVFSK